MRNAVRFLAIGAVVLACVSDVRADDVGGDGVDDAIDVCNNTPPGTAVDAEGRPLGDIDRDCDTDLDDFALFQLGFTGPLAPPGMVIETVPVGNPGNANDTEGAGYGGVDYEYNIGAFEVTAGQYTEFLNAVADEDTYGLYNASMFSSSKGCKIRRTGSSGSYVYLVDADGDDVEDADWLDRPVNYVSWGDAARFANWLYNGQPTGVQDDATTEDGSYYLNGAMSDAELLDIVRKPDATWVIPSEDEWYKAAYYDGGSGVYYDYPTGTDNVPSNVLSNPDPDPGNNANFAYAIGSPYYRTVVGDFENSDSPYGTFDQGGNVFEWNEAILYGSYRGVRGGSFITIDYALHASHRYYYYPTYEYHSIGFRVAEVPPPGLVIETVPVGNPGNADDTHDDGYGGVAYAYNIGTFEVTAGQYTEFLNAVAATDTYGLYNPRMDSEPWGCQITEDCSSGSCTYDFSGGTVEAPGSTAADWENRPVNYVSWGDAARFANWLHNGQPTGAQDLSTTEDGSYCLNGATSFALMEIDRKPDATCVIPSEDEWYKAAYHYNNGVTGNYYNYPTSSDIVPSNDLVDPDPGNNASFVDSGYTIGSPYWRTEVGAHENSDSPYGTFDQGGNVWEWTEAVIGPYRGSLGGSFAFYGDVSYLHAASRIMNYPSSEHNYIGFRVAEVSEPDCTHDGDGDEDVDLYDFASYQATFTDARCYALFHVAFNGPQ